MDAAVDIARARRWARSLAVGLVPVLGLSGCSNVPQWASPVNWYDRLFNADAAPTPPPETAALPEQEYPEVADVPRETPAPMDAVARAEIAADLAAAAAAAQAAGQALRENPDSPGVFLEPMDPVDDPALAPSGSAPVLAPAVSEPDPEPPSPLDRLAPAAPVGAAAEIGDPEVPEMARPAPSLFVGGPQVRLDEAGGPPPEGGETPPAELADGALVELGAPAAELALEAPAAEVAAAEPLPAPASEVQQLLTELERMVADLEALGGGGAEPDGPPEPRSELAAPAIEASEAELPVVEVPLAPAPRPALPPAAEPALGEPAPDPEPGLTPGAVPPPPFLAAEAGPGGRPEQVVAPPPIAAPPGGLEMVPEAESPPPLPPADAELGLAVPETPPALDTPPPASPEPALAPLPMAVPAAGAEAEAVPQPALAPSPATPVPAPEAPGPAVAQALPQPDPALDEEGLPAASPDAAGSPAGDVADLPEKPPIAEAPPTPAAEPEGEPARPAEVTPPESQIVDALPADLAGGQDTLAQIFSRMLAQSNTTALPGALQMQPEIAVAEPAVSEVAVPELVVAPPEPAVFAAPARPAAPLAVPAGPATLYFAHDSSELDAGARAQLLQIAERFAQLGGNIRIVGHASSRTADMPLVQHMMVNFEISMNRAGAVADELTRLGVPARALVIEAVGDSQPLFAESMPAGEAANRRVEIFVGA